MIKGGIKYEYQGGDMEEAQRIIEKYPEIPRKFNNKDVVIAVVQNNVAEYPGIDPSGTPRGWPRGSTYKDVPALFFNERVIIVATSRTYGQSNTYKFLHEIGHALDFITTSRAGVKSSGQAAFVQAYKSDTSSINKMNNSYYFNSRSSSGRSEMYVHSFAAMKSDRNSFSRNFPALYKYWKERGW